MAEAALSTAVPVPGNAEVVGIRITVRSDTGHCRTFLVEEVWVDERTTHGPAAGVVGASGALRRRDRVDRYLS